MTLPDLGNRAVEAARLRRQLAWRPDDRVAWHNLAAAEGDLSRAQEAEAAARRAIALGISAPETYLVLGRALQAQRKLDDAQQEFETVLRQRPTYAEAHRDYAQLLWMRTARVDVALRRLDATLSSAPRDPGLHLVRSIVLEFAGDEINALVAAERGLSFIPGDPPLLRQASRLCARLGKAQRALELVRKATLSTSDSTTQTALAEILLAVGELDSADEVVSQLRKSLPVNQHVIALQATLWRLRGDARYHELYNYAELVSVQRLDLPPHWADLDSFLAEVAAELERLHSFVAHPFQQSVRGGGQLTLQEHDLARPLVEALFTSINEAVHRHLARIGTGNDPMRSLNRGHGVFNGAWSVRLASGGSHVDHTHPQGWLSSACYIALPATIGSGAESNLRSAQGRAGWLRFGQPGIPTAPMLEADHFIRPETGMLALFPAYMWHGVVPFTSETPRLAVAFDVVPG